MTLFVLYKFPLPSTLIALPLLWCRWYRSCKFWSWVGRWLSNYRQWGVILNAWTLRTFVT